MKIRKAIILGAGFGKRMRPITKKIPKPLIKIKGVTLLENSIKFLCFLNIKHIVVNAHYLHKEITNFLKQKIVKEVSDFDIKKLKIKQINNKETHLISGPYTSVNLLKNDYIKLKNFGFEELDIYTSE